MPMIDADGCPINVSVEGRDNAPALMLSNSLGTTLADVGSADGRAVARCSCDPLRPARPWQIRGAARSLSHGALGRDVLAMLDALNIKKAHWCGLSMGGMVGQWLGANAPERFDRIILSNTTCYYPDRPTGTNRIKAVKEGGLAAIADNVSGWFTADFRDRSPRSPRT